MELTQEIDLYHRATQEPARNLPERHDAVNKPYQAKNKEPTMEFNTDVLGVIRAFARPQMQFVNEWVAAHRAIEENHMTYSESFHADVKEKLFTSEATQYMDVFVPYIAAAVATNRFTLVRDRFPIGSGRMTPDDWEDLKFWQARTREAMDERHRLHEELFLMLYGPPEPWSDDE